MARHVLTLSGAPPTVADVSPPDEIYLDLALSRTSVDRSAQVRTDAAALATALAERRTRILVLREGATRVTEDGSRLRLLMRPPTDADASGGAWFLGARDGVAYLAVEEPAAPDDDAAPDRGWRTLREIGADLDDADAGLLTTATALAEWHRRHGHCPRCGGATEVTQGGWVRRCPEDGSEHHPRTDPAIIVAVTDPQDRLLMGTGVAWPEGRVSVLAGFVEAGESLEAAVVREVSEEVGVRVTDLSYRGNQPWPFPASLMFAFRASTTTTSLVLQESELRHAQWYTREQLESGVRDGSLTLPSRVSIARRLIEEWFGRDLPGNAPAVPQ